MEIPSELIEQFARDNGVLFVGAGLSQGAGLPHWADLVRDLTDELEDCPPNADPRDIAQYYDIEYGHRRLVERLRDRLDTLNVKPTPIHEQLVKLPVSTIFTTNYDDLLEQALRAAKRPYTRVVDNADVGFRSSDRLQLVKLHGDLDQPESIVITAEDYERFAITRASLADILKVTLQTRTVLFLGYGATDPELRLILAQVREESGRLARNLYTVQSGAPLLVAKSLERQGLKVADLGAQPDTLTCTAVLLQWLEGFTEEVRNESQRLSRQFLTRAQTPVEELTDELVFWLKARGYLVKALYPCENWCVDVVTELPEGVPLLIRCVDGEIDLRRVQQLEEECSKQSIPIGWIVADKRVAPSARDYAVRQKNVRVLNLADFMKDIFDPYFAYLARSVEKASIPKHYVPLACEKPVYDSSGREFGRDPYPVLDEYVYDWLKERGRSHISILGDFGAGKTWFCLHFAYKQLQRYLDDPVHQRIPLLISLRDYARTEDISQLITDLLSNRYRVRISQSGLYDVFDQMNRSGRLLLIFDGFDEMARRMDRQTVVKNFWKLSKAVVPGGKAILTCRTHYFRYSREAQEVLGGQRTGREVIDLAEHPEFEILHLRHLDESQVHEALRRRLGEEPGDDLFERLTQIHDLRDLATRPVLLKMIAETIDHIEVGKTVNIADLYRMYTDRWLNISVRERRTSTSRVDKLFFMEELAWEMYQSEQLDIHYSKLPERIMQHFSLEYGEQLDHLDFDLRTQSFLQRDRAGDYYFAHKSFLEYFVACKLARELGVLPSLAVEEVAARHAWRRGELVSPRLAETFGIKVLPSEIHRFLADLIEDPDLLWAAIQSTNGQTPEVAKFTGANAITLLLAKGESCVAAQLAGSVIAGADLFNADFSQAKLRNACLRGTQLLGCAFENTDLRSADLRDCAFVESSGIYDVAFSPDLRSIAAACEDGEIQIWSLDSRHLTTRLRAHEDEVWGIEYHPQGRALLSSSVDGSCKVWEWPSNRLVKVLKHLDTPVRGACYSPDGHYIATQGDDKLIKVWDARTYRLLNETRIPTQLQQVFSLWISPGGKHLAAALNEHTIRIYELGALQPYQDLRTSSRIREFRWNPHGDSLAASCWDGPVEVWHIDSRDRFALADRAYTLSFHPKGDYVAVSLIRPQGMVELWDPKNRELILNLQGHTAAVYAIAYSMDGERIATGSYDGSIRIWCVNPADALFGQSVGLLKSRMNCEGMRIGGARGLSAPAPDRRGTLRDWLIARGAVE